MNYLEIWCNLKDSSKDLKFADAVEAYLNHLKENDMIHSWRLTRRKFGFGPQELGEFHIQIASTSLEQLDQAFGRVATRDESIERLHIPVYSAVRDVKSALYREFPDEVRVRD